MIETIKAIILDFQEAQLETGVSRRVRIEKESGKAVVCIGVRRSGKSTYMFKIMERLFAGGVLPENILYLNFFDDRLHNLGQEGRGKITDACYSLFPEKKNSETVHCFFDEIQAIPAWEPFVDRLMRTEKCQIYFVFSGGTLLTHSRCRRI